MIQPALSIILGNYQYDSHVLDCRVVLGLLPAVNHAVVTLPAGVEMTAAHGDDASLKLLSDGEMTPVITGVVERIDRRFHAVSVLLADAGRALSRLRPAATYEAQDSGKIMRALAGDAGIDIGVIDANLPLVSYAAHQQATAAEHIARLAALSGCLAGVGDDGRLEVISRPAGRPDLALLYGREFVRYETRESAPPADQLVLAGHGPAGDPAEPGAARHSLELLPAGAPEPGQEARRVAVPLLKTPAAAVSAGQAANTARAAGTISLTAHCFLQPQLRPGQVVEVQELPDGVPAGPWLITGVRHALRPGGAGQTTVEAELADLAAFGLDALLGAALGAIGGLL